MSNQVEVTAKYNGEEDIHTGHVGLVVVVESDTEDKNITIKGELSGVNREDYTKEDLNVALAAIATQAMVAVISRIDKIETGLDVIKYMSNVTELVLEQLTAEGDEV